VDGRELASEHPGSEHERGDDPGPYRRRRSTRYEDVQPDQGQHRVDTVDGLHGQSPEREVDHLRELTTCWLEIASTCVMVPKKTENWLRFSAGLADGTPEIRFELAFRT
jgi:hypothetical protein